MATGVIRVTSDRAETERKEESLLGISRPRQIESAFLSLAVQRMSALTPNPFQNAENFPFGEMKVVCSASMHFSSSALRPRGIYWVDFTGHAGKDGKDGNPRLSRFPPQQWLSSQGWRGSLISGTFGDNDLLYTISLMWKNYNISAS